MTKIYKTACVSFPRSGYHALQAVLTHYFGEDPGYGEEHDISADGPGPVPGIQYLIQVRNPIEAIQSWTDLDARFGLPDRNSTRALWSTDFRMKAEIWLKWYQKWVIADIPQRLVVFYNRLLANPYGVSESVIQFLTHEQVDPIKLKAALETFPIISRQRRHSHWINVA